MGETAGKILVSSLKCWKKYVPVRIAVPDCGRAFD